MEFGSSSGGGGDHDSSGGGDSQRRKQRYHRHTAEQIGRLESVFKECPHPEEKQRSQLSRELGLSPRQIKFWFQNRRTQMKTQHERADNCTLRVENDTIRCENIAMRETLKNMICPNCGGPPVTEGSLFDEQKLRMENAQLKEELDRVSSIASKYIGRPVPQLPPVQPIHVSSLDLTMGTFRNPGHVGPSLDLDLDLLAGGSSTMPNFPVQPVQISEMDKSLIADIAANAMKEMLTLMQTNEPLWMKSGTDGKDVLNLENYEKLFPRSNGPLKNPNVRIEASRDSGVVIMNGLALVAMFMDTNKWVELFPTIVSGAKTIEVLSAGMLGTHSGALQLMCGEMQVLSPLAPTREFCFLRHCQQVDQGSWAIVDVSYEIPCDPLYAAHCQSRRLPSGCLIQDMPNGYSNVVNCVTWLEHVEIEDQPPLHSLYADLFFSGLAFGAPRWLASLKRMCTRFACLMVSGTSTRDLLGVIPSPEGKNSVMKLAQRMVSYYCSGVGASKLHQRTIVSNENGVRVSVIRNENPGQPNGVVLCAVTTIWLPIPPQQVFNLLKNESTRAQWDVLCHGSSVEEVVHIANGSDPGNCISVLRAFNTSQNSMLILQESLVDSSESLVIYCPVELPAINTAMSGEDPTHIPLLPCGFAISPDGRSDKGHGASSSSNTHGNIGCSGGSLITVSFQMLVCSVSSARINMETVNTVNNLIGTTIQNVKTALNCLPSLPSLNTHQNASEVLRADGIQ